MILSQPWAVILAGGDGKRLLPLTRLIWHDDRPKQFCEIFGGSTLLAQTRTRVLRAFALEQTLIAVVKTHERYYERELADVRPSRLVVQPVNKGTTAAIAYSLLRIISFDPDATVAFFPADHYYSDDEQFIAGVESAVRRIGHHGDSLILLGAEARHPEVEYGWIEPGPALKCCHGSLLRVRCFWEKPSLQTARTLLECSCLWNTFVMVGRAQTFLGVLKATTPALLGVLAPLRGETTAAETQIDRLYQALSPGDFSQEVLSRCVERLNVLRLSGVDWSDLGKPERVIAAMGRAGVEFRLPEPVGMLSR